MPQTSRGPADLKKTLVIVRHAHRDTRHHLLDNGLTPKGREQAKKILKFYKTRFSLEKPWLLTSPKIRCVQTISPLALWLDISLVKDQRLLDLRESKSGHKKSVRVQHFLHWWEEKAPALTLVCSHGNWIEEVLLTLSGKPLALKKGGWAEFVVEGKTKSLTWFIPTFKYI